MPNMVFEVDGSGTVIFSDWTGAGGPGTGAVRVFIAGSVEPAAATSALHNALIRHSEAKSGNWDLARNSHWTVT